ncbi:type 1 glutamine amidotransferase domain-containing protein [Bacteriovorax sp. BSW11_IV]|uniref:type 1 glutamine amidotransferase domain-containing protein n=1 Tax=Bacteriovorax sp. BSW11_IV TaxID=1353529 RepID=UPI0018CAB2F4|nr:type 1 glutamine amidotransferase domain-containing protein [Bacteriovorax sp. BSW11_IV]
MKLKLAESKKILIIVTNHEDYPNREDKTGLWLTELTHFYDEVKEAGFEVDIASPNGGKSPLDERSLGWMYIDKEAKKHLKNPEFTRLLDETLDVSKLNGDDYIAIYFAGGHGTMWDFKDNPDLKLISEQIYNNEGYVTSVCHGAAGLLNLQAPSGKPLIENKKITGFSNTEEWLAGLTYTVPFSLEDELKALNPIYKKALFPFVSYAVSDGRIVTGQNPNSGKAVAKELLRLMRIKESH